jgi:hypothetical protein
VISWAIPSVVDVSQHRIPGEGVVAREKWAGSFYLEDSTVRSIDIDFDGLDTPEGNPWFVVKQVLVKPRKRDHWLHEKAQLRAFFGSRIPYPQYTVSVYYYDLSDTAGLPGEG